MSERKPTELAEFLSVRRARLTPQDVGLEGQAPRRRVPGLRREELARLAGVSVDYYTRLEQGRSRSASADVLDALAAALQLNDAERQHLHLLAQPQPAQRKRRPRPQSVDMATLRLLELFDQVSSPAFVLGRRLDVLAHNRLAGALITEFRELPAPLRNQARFVFLDPHARELYADWNEVAADTAALLRLPPPPPPHHRNQGLPPSARGRPHRQIPGAQPLRRPRSGPHRLHHRPRLGRRNSAAPPGQLAPRRTAPLHHRHPILTRCSDQVGGSCPSCCRTEYRFATPQWSVIIPSRTRIASTVSN